MRRPGWLTALAAVLGIVVTGISVTTLGASGAPAAAGLDGRGDVGDLGGLDPDRLTVLDMQRALSSHHLSSRALTTFYLNRIRLVDPKLHSVIETQPGVTGVTFPHSNPDALASAVSTLLADEVFAGRVAREAKCMVSERYCWKTIAARTASAYLTALHQSSPLQARLAARHPDARPTIVVPDGNLLAAAGAAS